MRGVSGVPLNLSVQRQWMVHGSHPNSPWSVTCELEFMHVALGVCVGASVRAQKLYLGGGGWM